MTKLLLTTTTVAGMAFLAASLAPAQLAAQDRGIGPPVQEQSVTGTFFNLTPSVDFERAAITVAGPKGYAFSDVVPGGPHVSADLALEPLPFDGELKGDVNLEGLDHSGNLPDGKYNYEVVLYHSDGTTTKISGGFRVEGGGAVESKVDLMSPPRGNELSQNTDPGLMQRLAGAIIDFVVPPAQAGITPNDFVYIQDNQADDDAWLGIINDTAGPDVFFWHHNNNIRVHHNGQGTGVCMSGSNGNVGIHTCSPLARLQVQGSTGATALRVRVGTASKLRVNSNGSVGIGGNFTAGSIPDDGLRVLGDTVLDGNTGIGTASPVEPLHIAKTVPSIRFQDTDGAHVWRQIAHENGYLLQDLTNGTLPIIVLPNSPTSLIAVPNGTQIGGTLWTEAASGNVAISHTAPSAALHVRRGDGTAQVLVEDSGGTSPLQMFRLINEGFPAFNLTDDSQANVSWTFRLSGTQNNDERFVITKLGTGQPEFALFADGSAEFQGNVTANGVQLTSSRELKTDFSSVDEHTLLEKVAALDVSQWRYKREPGTERHIGPMAEDFREVFGLGDGRHISAGDAQGILFAAAKALEAENEAKDRRIADLETRMARMEAMLDQN